MYTGKIKFYSRDKGFGFIEQDNGNEDLFFHFTSLINTDDIIGDGDQVSYDVADGDRGLKAVKLSRI